jgi:hypothetical protein
MLPSSLVTLLVVAATISSSGSASPLRPKPTLRFHATMHVAQGLGHAGDGCIAARAALQAAPIVSKVAFDGVAGRLRQSNVRLEQHPRVDTTNIGDWSLPVAQQWVLTMGAGGVVSSCTTEPLPAGAKFGSWGSVRTIILPSPVSCPLPRRAELGGADGAGGRAG